MTGVVFFHFMLCYLLLGRNDVFTSRPQRQRVSRKSNLHRDASSIGHRGLPNHCACALLLNSYGTHTLYETRVRFQVLTVMVLEGSISWDTTPCDPLKINLRFGGLCHLHLHLSHVFTLIYCLHYSSTLKI
jgi:hypothetical protein